MKDTRPIVAVTMGDAAGIGPEVVAKALASGKVWSACRPLVIGDGRIMGEAMALVGNGSAVRPIATVRDAAFTPGTVDVLDLANLPPGSFTPGQISAACGRAFVEYIRTSARLALAGDVDAVASAPTNKESMHAAGERYSGQTDIYAEETGTHEYFTVLTGGASRVFLVTSHVSLRQAIDMVRRDRVESVIRLAHAALRDVWKIPSPRIGVAGLNPHAGDGGLFGDEEINEVIPVVAKLRAEGMNLTGPDPADSLYWQSELGEYDGVIGMYHDQGVIPLKRYGYVTVIVGTPIIRTTAGHGTAYGIAWKGVARADVMENAILVAADLASRRQVGSRAGG